VTVARRLFGAFAGIIICSLPLAAQSTGAIRGRVLDSASSQALSNVSMTVEGTQPGVLTGLDGAFNFPSVVPGAHRVNSRRIGYHSTAVAVTALRRPRVSVSVDCPFHH
jgi:hypothetical protein